MACEQNARTDQTRASGVRLIRGYKTDGGGSPPHCTTRVCDLWGCWHSGADAQAAQPGSWCFPPRGGSSSGGPTEPPAGPAPWPPQPCTPLALPLAGEAWPGRDFILLSTFFKRNHLHLWLFAFFLSIFLLFFFFLFCFGWLVVFFIFFFLRSYC